MTETKEPKPLSVLDGLPLLNLTIAKGERHRSQKRDRNIGTESVAPSASISGDSGDNQTTHLCRKNLIGHSFAEEDQAKTKRWACVVEDESLLPHIEKPAMVSPQQLNSPLRKMHNHRTWHGSLKQRGDNRASRSLQRRASSSDDTLATFEATETILLAEIDSDERCASFLRQRAPQETRVSYPGDNDSPLSQIQYKLCALDRKIQMNKEKLAQVRQRIAGLGGKPSGLTIDPEENKSELTHYGVKKNEHVEDKRLDANQQSQASTSMKTSPGATNALIIQCAFRAFRARCVLAARIGKTYQRVLNPGNNQYFYYNRVARLSQWEAPTLLRRCHYLLDAKPVTQANPFTNDPTLDAAAKVIQNRFRQRALRVFLQDYKLGNLEKVFDARFGAWYYFNSRTNHSFWENVHHVRLTAANSAIYHHQY
ncbi:hypothetical protein PC128_g1201 [Phytophthora cactorum]|nr:hypothetical protein PC128_g1201 [Phytophthora cactorum]KAG4062487.1 hypothetical protein PC123_g2653 [Phytophthora cactorum]